MDEADHLRNIGIVAHIDAGKTTVTERILYYSGKSYKIGEVHDGSATMDWMVQEQERGITITSAVTTCFWKVDGDDYAINIVDTPGHLDFTVEVERSLGVLDSAIVVVCGVAGVQPQTETVWRQSEKYGVPKMFFINKLDRDGADFEKVLESLREKIGATPVVLFYPHYADNQFQGVVDVIGKELVRFSDENMGMDMDRSPVTEDMLGEFETYRVALLEALSEYDDEIATLYLEEVDIPVEKLNSVLRDLTVKRKIQPVFSGTALKNKGVQPLLDGVCKYFPSPKNVPPPSATIKDKSNRTEIVECDPKGKLAAFVYKIYSDSYSGFLYYVRVYSGTLKSGSQVLNTNSGKKERIAKIFRMHANKREEVAECTAGNICSCVGLNFSKSGDTLAESSHPIVFREVNYPIPVISSAIEAKSSGDLVKLNDALEKISKEDPSFKMSIDKDTGQTIINGMGELHLEIVSDRLKNEFKVDHNLGKPQVSYKETVVAGIDYTESIDRQIENKSVQLSISVSLKPNGENKKTFGVSDSIELPAHISDLIVATGKEALMTGILSGYELIGIDAEITKLELITENPPPAAFGFAVSLCLRNALLNAECVLLEPVMLLEVDTPTEFTGDIIGDINSRKGKILHLEEENRLSKVKAFVKLSGLFGYSTDLRSLSQGKAFFSMGFDHYEKQQVLSQKN